MKNNLQMDEIEYWDNEWQGRGLDPTSDFAKEVYPVIAQKKLVDILDLGCGNGRDSIFFAEQGLSVTALDIAAAANNFLKDYQNIHFLQQNIKDIDFPANSFDAVFANLSLHYFDDETTRNIIDKLFDSLRTGGYLFIKCKSTDDLLFGQGQKIADNVYVKDHQRHFFTIEYMQDILKKFKLISVKATSSVHRSYQASFIEAVAQKVKTG